MITRDVSQIMVVPALAHNVRFHSCTVTGFTCYTDGATSALGSSEYFPGFAIDRLALPRNFNAVLVAPVVYGAFGSSGAGAGDILVGTLSAGIMHASASGGTFAAYSTADWIVGKGLWRQTTATCADNRVLADKTNTIPYQRDVGLTTDLGIGGLTSTTTSTSGGQNNVAGTSSTGMFYYAGPGPFFSLTGAKRYIKVVMRTQFETTGCGSGGYHMSAGAIFGEPDEAAPPLTGRRILVTSGCAT